MKSINLLFLLFTTYTSYSQVIKAQVVKTYTGPLDGGVATYQYYENENYERVFHGTFKFKGMIGECEGAFKDNIKIGNWKYKNTFSHGYPGAVELTDVSYNNGMLNGPCTFIAKYPKSGEVVAKKSANFYNTLQVGDYSFIEYTPHGMSIVCHFNGIGELDGECKVAFTYDLKDYTDVLKYKEGILISRLLRTTLSGDVIISMRDATRSDSLTANYLRYYNSKKSVAVVADLIIPFSQKAVGQVSYLDFYDEEDYKPVYKYTVKKYKYPEYNTNGGVAIYHNITLAAVVAPVNWYSQVPNNVVVAQYLDFTFSNLDLTCNESKQLGNGNSRKYCRGVSLTDLKPAKKIVGLVRD